MSLHCMIALMWLTAHSTTLAVNNIEGKVNQLEVLFFLKGQEYLLDHLLLFKKGK